MLIISSFSFWDLFLPDSNQFEALESLRLRTERVKQREEELARKEEELDRREKLLNSKVSSQIIDNGLDLPKHPEKSNLIDEEKRNAVKEPLLGQLFMYNPPIALST